MSLKLEDSSVPFPFYGSDLIRSSLSSQPIAAKDSAEEEEEEEEEDTEEEEEQRNGLPRRGGLARLQLRRRGKQKPPSEPSLEDVGAESPSESDTRPTKRVGAKKLAKMQRKEEARQNRQVSCSFYLACIGSFCLTHCASFY